MRRDVEAEIMALLRGRPGGVTRPDILAATGLPSGSLSNPLARLEALGELHRYRDEAGRRMVVRLGPAPILRDVHARDYAVDDSERGPNGGRVVKFGDRWPSSHAQRGAAIALSGGSSLNSIY